MPDKIFEPEVSRSLKKFAMEINSRIPVAIECKREAGTNLAFKRIEDHQVDALMDFEYLPFVQKLVVSAGKGTRFRGATGFDFLHCPKGRSYILVNFRNSKKSLNRCFALHIDEFLMNKNSFLSDGKKSFPFSWFEENALEIDRIKWEDGERSIYGWNLSPLLNHTNI